MDNLIEYWPTLLLVYITTFVIIISPGPSSFAIISTSMAGGRKSGILVACGVVCGALTWGSLGAVGVSTLLVATPNALTFIKIFGGVYLLFLACKSFLKVFVTRKDKSVNYLNITKRISFLKGYGIHMSNPEAMMGWIAIISLGVNETSPKLAPLYIVSGCVLIAIVTYGSYAFLFSSEKIANLYLKLYKVIESLFTLIFGFAGITLLMTVI